MRRQLFLQCALIGFSGVLQVRSQAVIEGSVKLSAGPAPVVTPRYQVKVSGAIASPDAPVAVVYLEGDVPRSERASPPAVAEMGQKNYQFKPGILVVQKGTRVQFPNYDDEYHNVLSYSKAKEFDLGRYRKDEPPPTVVFDKPGVVALSCEIHEHMSGTILVVDTPYFTKTDTNGTYRLEHLAAGHYTLKAWLNARTVWQRPVDLTNGMTLRVDFPGP